MSPEPRLILSLGPVTRLVLSLGPVPTRTGVVVCSGSRRRLAWSSHLDPFRLVAVWLAVPAPTGKMSGPLMWFRPGSCRCPWLPRLPPVLVWSSHVDPSRLVSVSLALPGSSISVSLDSPGRSYRSSCPLLVSVPCVDHSSPGPLVQCTRGGALVWSVRCLDLLNSYCPVSTGFCRVLVHSCRPLACRSTRLDHSWFGPLV